MAYIYWKKSVVFPLMEISLAMPLIPFYPLNLSFYIFRPTLHTTFDSNFFFSVSTPISSFPESFPRTNIRYQHSFLSLDFLVSTIPFRISYRGRIASSNVKIFQVSISSRQNVAQESIAEGKPVGTMDYFPLPIQVGHALLVGTRKEAGKNVHDTRVIGSIYKESDHQSIDGDANSLQIER